MHTLNQSRWQFLLKDSPDHGRDREHGSHRHSHSHERDIHLKSACMGIDLSWCSSSTPVVAHAKQHGQKKILDAVASQWNSDYIAIPKRGRVLHIQRILSYQRAIAPTTAAFVRPDRSAPVAGWAPGLSNDNYSSPSATIKNHH